MALVRITRMNGTIDIVKTSRAIEEINVELGDKIQILDEALLSEKVKESPDPAPNTELDVEPNVVVQVTNGTDFVAGNTAGDGINPVGVVGVAGDFGALFMFSNGNFEYDLNYNDPRVQALRSGDSLEDVYSYALTDGCGGVDTSSLTIEICGSDNGPKIRKDNHAADILRVRDITDVTDELAAPVSIPERTNHRLKVIGHVGGDKYGELKLTPDGSYDYSIDESNTAVIALCDGEKLTEVYTYLVTDGTKTTAATLTIHITGVDDGPAIVSASHQLAAAIGDFRLKH
ncbi:MAG: VCBS domain-containing protein [Alphaproteobacteria bacterium]|nr:VCBS domain-containing protein [Alphaproteobacteria bacterium]